MFGLEYFIAFIKVFINVAFSIVGAIPFYYSWNCIAPIYLSFIPVLYQKLPFWHIAGFFIVCTFIGEQVQKLTPSIININNNLNDSKEKP